MGSKRRRQSECPDCEGTGVLLDDLDCEYECPNCDGCGMVWYENTDELDYDPDVEDMTPYKDNVLGD